VATRGGVESTVMFSTPLLAGACRRGEAARAGNNKFSMGVTEICGIFYKKRHKIVS